jgi:hypothetical protein
LLQRLQARAQQIAPVPVHHDNGNQRGGPKLQLLYYSDRGARSRPL